MSIFRKVLKIGGNLLKTSGLPGGAQVGGMISGAAAKMSKGGLRALPGAGTVLPTIGGTVAGTVIGDRLSRSMGSDGQPSRRRRSKGITGTQLKGFRRVVKVLEQYNCFIKSTKGSKTCR